MALVGNLQFKSIIFKKFVFSYEFCLYHDVTNKTLLYYSLRLITAMIRIVYWECKYSSSELLLVLNASNFFNVLFTFSFESAVHDVDPGLCGLVNK